MRLRHRQIMEDFKVKEALAASGFKFKKQFGQNFITDINLLKSIVEGSGIDSGSTVVEVGCGAGTLTREIAARAKKVVAFEIDRDLQPVLSVTLAGVKNAELVFRDFAKTDMQRFEEQMPPYHVIANLPYYITTPLVMKFIEEGKKCLSLTVMVQEEVAERFCAMPATPQYGAVTAAIALCGRCRIIRRVPRNLFTPSPNVDSAVVHVEIVRGNVPVKDEAMYKKVVRAAFFSRRKTLENNLMQAFSVDRERARNLLESCGIAPMARGEQLSPQQFAAIADKLSKQG